MKRIAKALPLYLLSIILLLLSFLPDFVKAQFGDISFEQILFILRSENDGANLDIVFTFFELVKLPLIQLTLVFWMIVFLTRYYLDVDLKLWKKQLKMKLSFGGHPIITTLIFLVSTALVLSNVVTSLGIDDYYQRSKNSSYIYDDYYVNPQDVTLTFPETKRNLIYIYLESMESNFSQAEIRGNTVNLIPNLTQIAKENIHFSDTTDLGGAVHLPGLTWTVASLLGHTAGIPLQVPIEGNSYGQDGTFLEGATTLGDILADNGYQNHMLMGSNGAFGGRAAYYKSHGNYTIHDYPYFIESKFIPEDHDVFWGMEDKLLFEYAQQLLLDLSQESTPFNVSILTVDTHFMDGYVDETCSLPYENDYANAISCSDSKLGQFISWIQDQDFYENTTIVLSGDHYTMNDSFNSLMANDVFTIYNAFINTPSTVMNDKSQYHNCSFSVMDLFPTTLDALDIKIEGNRLGLGANLFSDQKSIIEILGIDTATYELNQRSDFYENQFIFGNRNDSYTAEENDTSGGTQ